MSEFVTVNQTNGVAVITVQNPPVNALGPGVPAAIADALAALERDAAVQAVVIIGGGKTFIAGADINELQAAAKNPDAAPDLHPLLARVEDSFKPIVMAIHGTCLGGGLELAMAGHYRVASPDAILGAPESNLGIIPGAEGTQRLPRLVGVPAAVELCVTGRLVKADESLKLGLIDRVIEGDLLEGACDFARGIAAEPVSKTRNRNGNLGTPEANEAAFAAGRELARKIRPHQTAPLFAIDALDAATRLPFEEGCKREREIAKISLASSQAQAMIHVFFAERGVSKVPGLPKDTPTYPIRKVGIIGAGTMGGGIAMACVNAGIAVLLKDTTQEGLDRGIATITKNYNRSVQRGRTPQAVMDQRMAMIHTQLTYDGFEEADLIIEAAFESMEVKKQLFTDIDKVAKKDCVLATNTSTLDIDAIAAMTSRPQMVVGLHFFSPANVMRLVEIVRGRETSPQTLATAVAVAKTLKKIGVVVGNGYGFVGNRMMFAYMREAQFLVEEGALPEQVDKVLTDFGMAMGIFAVDDLGGIDLLYRVRQETKHLDKPGVRKPVVHDRVYEAGRYGQKRNAGWYKYDEKLKPSPDPIVHEIIEKTSKELGFTRREISNEEIIERCFYVMVNEGAKILEDGLAGRAADIDVIYTTGYGFPTWRGGPMWFGDTVGLKTVYDRICEFERQFGSDLWAPSPLLKRLAESGSTFAAKDEALPK
ncbi:MAG: 3-hydroxyacyl-CoA dehydrogenase NAD-binding domain-containing protein [Bryobacteraceae bacterium]